MRRKKARAFLWMLLAAMIAVSTAAMAEEKKASFGEVGMDIDLSSVPEDMQGLVVPYPMGPIDMMHHTYMMTFIYVALPGEEAEHSLYSATLTAEEEEKLIRAQYLLTVVLGTDGTFDSAREAYDTNFGAALPLDYDAAAEAGSSEGFTFYAIPLQSGEFLSSVEDVFAEEYKELEQVLLEAEQNADFRAPDDDLRALTGEKLQFTTTDLDGNTVTSEELFSPNEITMLNCWGTWCPNCTYEMEELARIHSRMQEKGCGIAGLEWERTADEATYRLAREQMEEFGTNYPNVLFPEGVLNWVTGFPTSIFVDREGTILGIPIVGARVDQYEAALDALLASKDKSAGQTDVKISVGEAVYVVHVVDEEGPVEDATVQFCNDTACSFRTTGEDGTAVFEAPAGEKYEIHLMKLPEGYVEDPEIYYPDESGEVTIRIQKEE